MPASHHPSRSQYQEQSHPPFILVVDDEKAVCDLTGSMLELPIVAQQLRVIRPHLPVLFVSGLVSQGNFQGVMGGWFLRKPYTQKLLVTKIQQLMASSS